MRKSKSPNALIRSFKVLTSPEMFQEGENLRGILSVRDEGNRQRNGNGGQVAAEICRQKIHCRTFKLARFSCMFNLESIH